MVDVIEEKVKYNGIVKLDDLYKLMHDLFDSFGWKIIEKQFRWKDDVAKGKKNVSFVWSLIKDLDDYCRALGEIKCRVFNWKKAQTPTGKEVEKAFVEIAFKFELVLDYKGDFEKPPLKYFKNFYEKCIYRKKFETHFTKIKEEIIRLINEIKAFLGLYKFAE